MTDIDDMIAAEAHAFAARTPGARVVMADEMAVVVIGAELPTDAVEEFAAHARSLDLDGPQPAAS